MRTAGAALLWAVAYAALVVATVIVARGGAPFVYQGF
jgi:hypothetical protein